MNKYIKYPRTAHFKNSECVTEDDIINNDDIFVGKKVVASIKMDGECTTLYNDYIHARSIDSSNHESRSWVKNFHNSIKFKIPNNYRICGENLYAKHSIYYDNLDSYFLGFSIWNDKNKCLQWNDTIELFNILNITPVPVFYIGNFDYEKIYKIFNTQYKDNHEGFVVRLFGEFYYDYFDKSVLKWVRKNHVTSDTHWSQSKIIKNKLRNT